MVTSSDDDSILVYDLLTGNKQRKVNFPKTGAHDIRYLHTLNDVILASRKNGKFINFY
jgi:myo-inositol-hexaphosphate 3-phosphohydrolase